MNLDKLTAWVREMKLKLKLQRMEHAALKTSSVLSVEAERTRHQAGQIRDLQQSMLEEEADFLGK